MCGLFFSTRRYSESELEAKIELMRRRGPDFHSVKINDGIAMAHARLAVVDLDERSHQPFEDQGRFLVFNGEIYNHKELRNELESLGYAFRTQSDTEVLLKSYIEFGVECLPKLNGMFAFVIYDSKENEILVARDRFGKKPLYYVSDADGFSASSLCTQLIESSSTDNLCSVATESFFKYKYVTEPNSIIENIKKLPAGCFIKLSVSERSVKVNRYYDITKQVRLKPRGAPTFLKASAKLSELLRSAVAMRLEADVPIGVFLSGGIDSSIVAAIAQEASIGPIQTFTVGFADSRFDESDAARAVAEHIGSNHTEILCNPSDMLTMLSEYAECYDEPFADPSALPTMLLCRTARNHVTVALTGDGADETFLGYNRYAKIPSHERVFRIPHAVRSLVARMLPTSSPRLRAISDLLALNDMNEMYHALLQPIDQRYFGGDIRKNATSYCHKNKGRHDAVSAAGLYDTLTYLPDNINVKLDRASMHNGLELRCPFLDYRVVEYGVALPQSYRFAGGVQKVILKEIASSLLPSQILNKPKSGFSAPIGEWFRNELRDQVMSKLKYERLREIPGIDAKVASELVLKHQNGKINKPNEVFKLLSYVYWQDRWMQ